jgi:hypothetical protein
VVRDAYKDSWDIKVLKQDGKGKGDAVRKGFAAATGEVLMIYPMESEAMRPLNLIANRFFAYLFSYLVNTR